MASYNGRILTKITPLYSELDCKVLCINYENVFPITRKLILYLRGQPKMSTLNESVQNARWGGGGKPLIPHLEISVRGNLL